MKINNKQLGDAAEVSSAEGTAFRELRKLLIAACVLAVVVYFVVGHIVDFTVARLSFEQEARLFGALPLLFDEGDPNDPRLARAQGILDRFKTDPQVPSLDYRLRILSEEDLNAFAFPGGTIGLTQGLFEALDEDIALAFVLGHELGHFRHRDHLRGLGRAAGVGLAYAVLFGGPMGNESMGNLFPFVLQRGYSRQQEEKADAFGVALVQRTYGRIEGVDRLFQILEGKDHLPPWGYMFATHPNPKDRIEDLKAYAARLAEESN